MKIFYYEPLAANPSEIFTELTNGKTVSIAELAKWYEKRNKEEPERWITTKKGVRVPIFKGQSEDQAIEQFFKKKDKAAQQKKREEKNKIKRENRKKFFEQIKKKVSPETKAKIESINIDITKRNTLPPLNKEVAAQLGIEPLPFRLRRKKFKRNELRHIMNHIEEINMLLGLALYATDSYCAGKQKGYINLITKTGDNDNATVMFNSTTGKYGYYEIIHYFYAEDRGVRNAFKIKKD